MDPVFEVEVQIPSSWSQILSSLLSKQMNNYCFVHKEKTDQIALMTRPVLRWLRVSSGDWQGRHLSVQARLSQRNICRLRHCHLHHYSWCPLDGSEAGLVVRTLHNRNSGLYPWSTSVESVMPKTFPLYKIDQNKTKPKEVVSNWKEKRIKIMLNRI